VVQTNLDPRFQKTRDGAIVESILRKCVHCGFCNATCPTYQLRGDELDGPRGRIYQMKQFFEGVAPNADMLRHLDRCLTCRSCETTCPSGVNYSQLLEIGRTAIEQELPRSWRDKLVRKAIVRFINCGWLFTSCLRVAQVFSVLLPPKMKQLIPVRQQAVKRSKRSHQRKVLMLEGCVQPGLAPNTNACAVNLLDRFGIEVIRISAQHCCGSAAMHTSEQAFGLRQAKHLIDIWWPYVDAGIEAIVISASGCGVTIRDFGRLLADDPHYAEKAQRISQLSCDLVELIETEQDQISRSEHSSKRVAVHTPCTLQHGLGINQRIERLLKLAGHEICRVKDAHLCCGSAGTYSMLQPVLSDQLRENKLQALMIDDPEVIVSANIGCQIQLSRGSPVVVRHWIELL